RPRRPVPTTPVVALTLAGALGAGAMAWRAKNEPVPPPPAPSASIARGRPTAMTDLPPPTAKSPEALVAYVEGMQAWRDANSGQAIESFKRAIALDPSLAIAHLRVAFLASNAWPRTNEIRESFARAAQGRDGMSERDQVLLDALEPALGRSPMDRKLLLERL